MRRRAREGVQAQEEGRGVNGVITPAHIDAERVRLSTLLSEAGENLSNAARRHALAEHAYRQAHATSILAATGTEVVKKATADKAAGIEMSERNKWRAEELVALEACRNLRAQLQTLASEAYGVNSEIRLAGN